MYIGDADRIPARPVEVEGAKCVKKQILVGPKEGWDGWVMRRFTLGGDGRTPEHSHPWPHIAYVLQGEGSVMLQGEEYPIGEGSVAYVPDGAVHQFKNRKSSEMTFLCIVPERGEDL